MDGERSKPKIKEENKDTNNKGIKSQKIDLELKRFKSHEVYLVTQKNAKKQKNENSSKDHKKIIINLSKTDKMIKPKPKKSFNNNSNIKPSKTKFNNNNNIDLNSEEGRELIKTQKSNYNKSKTKNEISTNCNKDKDTGRDKEKHKLTVNNYINSVNGQKNIINTSKILNEESIQEIDSEDNTINIVKIKKTTTVTTNTKNNDTYFSNNNNTKCNKAKNMNINNKNNYTNKINMNLTNNYYIESNDKNKIIKKINFDEIQNSSNIKKNININNSNNINEIEDEIKNRELLMIAKRGDKEKILELLSTNQININYQNENGWSALHFACDEGNLKIVDILIRSKIDINLITNEKKNGFTPCSIERIF
jgi:hypothetical protein